MLLFRYHNLIKECIKKKTVLPEEEAKHARFHIHGFHPENEYEIAIANQLVLPSIGITDIVGDGAAAATIGLSAYEFEH